jgi:hypothetical protein
LAITSHANGYFTEVIIQENSWKKEKIKIEGTKQGKKLLPTFPNRRFTAFSLHKFYYIFRPLLTT